jgi:hypothetical protein
MKAAMAEHAGVRREIRNSITVYFFFHGVNPFIMYSMIKMKVVKAAGL